MFDSVLPVLGDREFTAIATLLAQSTGITYSKNKRSFFLARLSPRLRQLGLGDFGAYVRLLRSSASSSERLRLVDLLTTHETSFWREATHFDVLDREVSERRPFAGGFKAWSAAASSGEESYSIAMTVARRLSLPLFEVWGTDVSQSVLASARRGLYPLRRAETIPLEERRRWCRKGQGQWAGSFLVTRELRARCHFTVGNLMQPQPRVGPFDVAFLRNVLIYFSREQQLEVIRNVVDRIKPGGLLIVGHSESAGQAHPALRQLQPSVFRVEKS